MVNAQEIIDKYYPKSGRKNITKIDISNRNLEGFLNLEGFTNLEELDCSNNLLTSIDFSGSKKLTKLALQNNNIEKTDLTKFSELVNLQRLYLGTDDEERINRNIYNRFEGSLKTLEKLTKLEKLDIDSTDIDSGLEHLPTDKLEAFWCRPRREDAKVKDIYELCGSEDDSEKVARVLKIVKLNLVKLRELIKSIKEEKKQKVGLEKQVKDTKAERVEKTSDEKKLKVKIEELKKYKQIVEVEENIKKLEAEFNKLLLRVNEEASTSTDTLAYQEPPSPK